MRDKFENIRYITPFPPEGEIEVDGLSPSKGYELVMREIANDTQPQLNYASLSTAVMEDGIDAIYNENLNKNIIQKPIYRETVDMGRRCVSMLLNLYNGDPYCQPTGVTTVSSTEAILLAGLNYRTRWENFQCGRCSTPKIIFGSNAAISWHKFARFFDVEPIIIPVTKGNRLDIRKLRELLDDDVICVVGTLGNTYTGAFDDIESLNRVVDGYNCRGKWKIPIHVDAASGGFIAPFCTELQECYWDFRLKWVKSINVNSSEYGNVYPGGAFALWRSRFDIQDELIYRFDYFGEPQENYTLNFTKSGANVIAQYYLFNRFGKKGYREVVEYLFTLKKCIEEGIYKIRKSGSNLFEIVENFPGNPEVVIKSGCTCEVPDFEYIKERMREFGWALTSYNLPYPNEDTKVMKIAIKIGLNLAMAEKLVEDFRKVVLG